VVGVEGVVKRRIANCCDVREKVCSNKAVVDDGVAVGKGGELLWAVAVYEGVGKMEVAD